jgi:prepilin peptidase CpaA
VSNAAFAVLATGLVAATIIDLKTRRIPNVLTAGIFGLGVVFAATGLNGVSLPAAILGAFIGLLLMLPGYTLGATGGGDVKLMGAVGALTGPFLVFYAFLFTAIAGGVLAVIIALQRNRLRATLAQAGRLMTSPGSAPQEIQAAPRAARFAYAPAIGVGTLLALLVR